MRSPYQHEDQRKDRGGHRTRRLRSHSERLASAGIIGLRVHALHDQGIDHDLGTTLCGIQNHAHDQRRHVVVDHERVGDEDGGNNERVEDEIGNTTMLQNGERIGDVTKHELVMSMKKVNKP